MRTGPVIAVVGGGIIGMSIAWRLAQAGGEVTVFDAGRIGNEASWAGAGMLAPGGEYESPSLWADLALESLSLYPAFVDELMSETGIPVDFRVCGAFTVAYTEAESMALSAQAFGQTGCGILSEQFPPSRIPGLQAGAVSAQYYHDDAVVNPRDVLRALRAACERARVTFREFTPIEDLPGAPFDRVVIAAGAWSSLVRIAVTQVSQAQASGEMRSPQLPAAFPVRGHLIAFEEHTGLCDTIVRHNSTYLLRRSAGVVIVGASTEHVGFDRTLDSAAAEQIAQRAGALIPELRARRYMAWNGFRPGSASGEPVMGRLGKSNIWLAYGHYRNGILLAPATARGIAREVLSSEVTPASSQTDWISPAVHPR